MRIFGYVFAGTALLAAIIVAGLYYQKYSGSVAELADMHQQLEQLRSERNQFQTQRETSAAQLIELEEQLGTLRARQHQTARELQSSRTHIKQLSDDKARTEQVLAGRTEELDKLREDITGLRQQRDEARRANARATRELEQIREQISSLKAELAELQQTQRTSRERIADLEQQRTDLREVLAVRDTELKDLLHQLEDKQQSVRALQASSAEQESRAELQLAELNRRIGDLETQVREQQVRNNRLTGELDDRDARVAALDAEKAALETDIARLEEQLTALTHERSELSISMEQIRAGHQRITEQLQQQIDRREVTISELENRLSLTFVDRIMFDFGKSRLSPEGEAHLETVADALENIDHKQVRVIGHTDPVPIHPLVRFKYPSNWELSTARAASVVRFLIDRGIAPESLEAAGRSYFAPVADNKTEDGRARNRRVQIIIAPDTAPLQE